MSRMSQTVNYDPHEHRVIAHPTNNFETFIHIVKCSLGTGILAMPQAFAHAGLINGAISTFAVGIICTYCLHVLVKSQYILCKRRRVPLLTYTESMKEALLDGPKCMRVFATASAYTIDFFLAVYQLGICCVYVVFVASNLKRVSDLYLPEPWDLRIWMSIILLPLILLNYLRNLKILVPFSQVANVVTFVGLGIVMYFVFNKLPPLDSRAYVGEIRNYALFVGTTLFALEAVGVIIALENNMKSPKSFLGYFGVLNQGMAVVVLLYAFVGFFGYVKYGDEAAGSITLNLDNKEILAQSVDIMFAFAICVSYALQCYVPVDIIWNSYLGKNLEESKKKLFYEYLVRTGLVILTYLLAMAVPQLGLFISLFGALCLSVLGLTFPALMELCVLWPEKPKLYWLIFIKDIILIILGLLALLIGTTTSISDIIKSYHKAPY